MSTKSHDLYDEITLSKLNAHKARLQQEADAALGLLESKLKFTFQQTKRNIVSDFSLPIVALGLLSPLGSSLVGSNSTTVNKPINWPGEIQQSIQNYSRKRTNRWTAFIPLLLKAGMEYRKRQSVHQSLRRQPEPEPAIQ